MKYVSFICSFILSTVVLSACSENTAVKDGCNALLGVHYLVASGSVGAGGTMEIAQASEGLAHGLRLRLYNPPIKDIDISSDDPVISLEGEASCSGNQVFVRFGPSAGENDQMRVIGGTLEGLFNLRDDEFESKSSFGLWNVDVFDKSKKTALSLGGYYKVVQSL